MQNASAIDLHIQDSKSHIAIVRSRFNVEITQALLDGALKGLKEAGVASDHIHIFEVPGAFEIPLAVAKIGESQKYQGVICLGVVIEGETPHFDYVCQGVTQGLMDVQLKTRIPLAFGVLTTHTAQQAWERASEGIDNKGYESAKVVLEMIRLLKGV